MKMMRMEFKLDRISNLPDDVTEKILSCLPLKDAVRTSILAIKWRYKWKMLHALVFDDECVSSDECTFTLANVVDHVLLLHPGPIHKFDLSSEDHELVTRDVDRWIFHLSSKPVIREITLVIMRENPYNVPSCLFSCQHIVQLELLSCLLCPPLSTLKAFRSLKTLVLALVTMTQDVFENLIGCNPLLERLELMDCGGFTNLNIDAPNLRYIYIIDGVFQQLNVMNSSKLVDATFNMQVNVDQSPGSSGNLIKFFHQHPHIQRLTMQRDFLQYLSIGLLPEMLPKPCQCLKFLALSITFHDPCEISTVLCLLRSSPTLHELDIMVGPEDDQPAVRDVKSCLYDNYNCTHTQLRLVKITDITCAKAQLDFIKFLLLSSPVLERMTVKPASVDEFPKLLKELLLFKRDSKGAEIMVLDP